MQKADIENKLELCIESFKSVLYERDETFLENMAKSNMDQGNLARYMLWEWTQGVGLYGLWKLFEKKHDQRCLDVLTEYYDARIAEGLPSKNINTMAPIFALSYLYEYTKNEKYGDICKEWAEWANARPAPRGRGRLPACHIGSRQRWRAVGRYAVHDCAAAGQYRPHPGPPGLY